MAGNLYVRATLGAADALVAVEGTPYSPDVVHDLQNRVMSMIQSMAVTATSVGVPVEEPEAPQPFGPMMGRGGDGWL